MKFKLTDLKSFKDNASFIKSNNLLPILSFIKFDNGKVTKNNLGEFIVQDMDFEGKFLIDERILFNFIGTASGDIEIKVTDKKVVLSDGFTKVSSPIGEFEHYPTTDAGDGEGVTIEGTAIDAIVTASKFLNPTGDMEYMKHVFVGNGLIAGSDGHICFVEKAVGLPKMILNRECCNALSKLSSATFSESKSYYFFEADGLKYGFIKPEQPLIDFTPFTKFDAMESFVCGRSEFIKFNDVAINSGQAKALTATMSLNGGLHLGMNDNDYGISVNKEINATGEMDGEFNFNPVLMNRLLKALPENELKFTKADKKYYITGQSDYLTLIMQMQ